MEAIVVSDGGEKCRLAHEFLQIGKGIAALFVELVLVVVADLALYEEPLDDKQGLEHRANREPDKHLRLHASRVLLDFILGIERGGENQKLFKHQHLICHMP